MDNKIYYIWLSLAIGEGSKSSGPLLQCFNSAEDIYKCNDFSAFSSLTQKQLKNLSDKSLDKAVEIYTNCKKSNIGIMTYNEDIYPYRLKYISAPPVVLYYRGRPIKTEQECLISVVGTRHMTDYGQKATKYFAEMFVSSGAIVVSGMASGVDAAAHRGALNKGGFTIAVLGTGIDKPYPRENEALYYEIIEKGLVISEYYPGHAVYASNFPMRNRIISGMSIATLVTEAGEKSGALITAKLASAQGREVFALPGIHHSGIGTNVLLQQGVKLAYRPADVLSRAELMYPGKIKLSNEMYLMGDYFKEYSDAQKQTFMEVKKSDPPADKPKEKNKDVNIKSDTPNTKNIEKTEKDEHKYPMSPIEKAVYDLLKEHKSKMIPDEIIRQTGLDTGDVLAALTVLEVYGEIVSFENGYKIK